MAPGIEIPIIVDSLSRDVDYVNRVARCIFLSIVADEPELGLDLVRNGQSLPFVMLALHGVLYQPLGGASEFTNTDQIDSLILAIEGLVPEGPFTVEIGVVWIPTYWLDAAYTLQPLEGVADADRGHLFRVSLSLFRELLRLTENRIDMPSLLQQFPTEVMGPSATHPPLRFSPRETQIFGEWAERQF